jgi:hypothetical protein
MCRAAQVAVAGLALLLIVLVISYCLWMIARPTTPAAEKKWAKAIGFSGGSRSGNRSQVATELLDFF